MYEKLYSKITDALVNDGYIVITDPLDAESSLSLLNEAKSENSFKRAGISGASDLHLDSRRRDE